MISHNTHLVFSLLTLFPITLFRIEFFSSRNTINSARSPTLLEHPPIPFILRASFFSLSASHLTGERACARDTRKASHVPPHAYCRALLIGPDPGGMKYKNRNKAPLPVPGEMLRYRIRDSAGAPSRARKQTQRNPAAVAAAPVLSALAARVLFFLPPSSIECRPSARLGGKLQAAAFEGKNGRNCPRFSYSARNSAIIDRKEGWLFAYFIRQFVPSRQIAVFLYLTPWASGTIPLKFSQRS